MSKKIVEHGNNLAIVIDKDLLKKLKIDKDTDLEIAIENNAIVIRACKSIQKKINQVLMMKSIKLRMKSFKDMKMFSRSFQKHENNSIYKLASSITIT